LFSSFSVGLNSNLASENGICIYFSISLFLYFGWEWKFNSFIENLVIAIQGSLLYINHGISRL